MQSSSPNRLAINLALLITLLIGIILIVHSYFIDLNWIYIVATSVFVFFIVFFAISTSMRNFIYNKVNPIYKTIKTYNVEEREIKKRLSNDDSITHVKNEVAQWAKTKTDEIQHLKKLEQYRKEFLGNVSHELKTPIFNIQGYVLTLLDGGLEDENINRKYLERTEKSINRMISIVQDLESISRLEAGELILNTKKFDIKSVFDEIFELHEMAISERNIKLKFEENYDKLLLVKADRDRISEVANNLIGNSIKYGKKGGKTTVSFMEMGENLLVDVTDTGIGIAEEDLSRIFERFYRTDKSRSREMGGTGLGLSIVKHIIEAHNQTINVRSTKGKGTSFAFTLKRAKK
ncbi:ATP-binding protein [Bacteroidales bacterium]|nr:ATP-binding protein [Bacteroidales bacterium]